MKVTPRIKEDIADHIQDGETDAEAILTSLVEFGIVDEEYEISDSEGHYDERYDKLVQEYILLEIQKQLKALV